MCGTLCAFISIPLHSFFAITKLSRTVWKLASGQIDPSRSLRLFLRGFPAQATEVEVLACRRYLINLSSWLARHLRDYVRAICYALRGEGAEGGAGFQRYKSRANSYKRQLIREIIINLRSVDWTIARSKFHPDYFRLFITSTTIERKTAGLCANKNEME